VRPSPRRSSLVLSRRRSLHEDVLSTETLSTKTFSPRRRSLHEEVLSTETFSPRRRGLHEDVLSTKTFSPRRLSPRSHLLLGAPLSLEESSWRPALLGAILYGAFLSSELLAPWRSVMVIVIINFKDCPSCLRSPVINLATCTVICGLLPVQFLYIFKNNVSYYCPHLICDRV
jgi:hypothetical protein